jgi:hypothetical protein
VLIAYLNEDDDARDRHLVEEAGRQLSSSAASSPMLIFAVTSSPLGRGVRPDVLVNNAAL